MMLTVKEISIALYMQLSENMAQKISKLKLLRKLMNSILMNEKFTGLKFLVLLRMVIMQPSAETENLTWTMMLFIPYIKKD